MAGKEMGPGIGESGMLLSRNIFIATAALALWFAHLGIATLAAIGALTAHAGGGALKENSRR